MRQTGLMSLGTEHAQNNQPMSESLARYDEPLTVTCPMRSQPKSSSRDEICCCAKKVKIQNPNTFFNSIVVDKVIVPHGDPDGTIFPWRSRDSSANATPFWVDTTPFWGRHMHGQKTVSTFATVPGNKIKRNLGKPQVINAVQSSPHPTHSAVTAQRRQRDSGSFPSLQVWWTEISTIKTAFTQSGAYTRRRRDVYQTDRI